MDSFIHNILWSFFGAPFDILRLPFQLAAVREVATDQRRQLFVEQMAKGGRCSAD